MTTATEQPLRRLPWRRVLSVWLLLMLAESVHGVLRQVFLAPAVGDLAARQLGVLIGSLLIFAIVYGCWAWLALQTRRQHWQAGALWALLTLAFEFSLGLLLGASLERLLSDYRLHEGGLMPLGLLFLALTPTLVHQLRQRDANAS